MCLLETDRQDSFISLTKVFIKCYSQDIEVIKIFVIVNKTQVITQIVDKVSVNNNISIKRQ